jgi:putative SOS response-associated peptidase YedK
MNPEPMCNDYAREIEIGRVLKLMKEMDGSEPAWPSKRVPNDIEPNAHIKIRDRGYVVRQERGKLIGDMTPWSWPGPRGKPVFNWKSENRNFSTSNRCLILATGFYEYTEPADPNVTLKDQHLFTVKGHEWFWIVGVIKLYAFAMLTTEPGPDIEPYHNRQIVVLPPSSGLDWLAKPDAKLLAPAPAGTLQVKTTRKDGAILP